MNCRPGDLAVVVRPCSSIEWFGRIDLSGTVVHCLSVDPNSPADDPVWIVEPRVVRFRVTGGTATAELHAVPDSMLKPLRDPGDDAKDEMLRALPQEVLA